MCLSLSLSLSVCVCVCLFVCLVGWLVVCLCVCVCQAILPPEIHHGISIIWLLFFNQDGQEAVPVHENTG